MYTNTHSSKLAVSWGLKPLKIEKRRCEGGNTPSLEKHTPPRNDIIIMVKMPIFAGKNGDCEIVVT